MPEGVGGNGRSSTCPLPRVSATTLVVSLGCSQRSGLHVATASQATWGPAEAPLSLVTSNLQALMIHQNEVILR